MPRLLLFHRRKLTQHEKATLFTRKVDVTYQCMYPNKHILPGMVGEVCRKYSSVLLAGEKIGSRLECRSLRSARIMASWADQDGQVSSRTALNFRPGIVLFFFANTIKFRGGSTRCMCLRV